MEKSAVEARLCIMRRLPAVIFSLFFLALNLKAADTISSSSLIFFESKIRPVLVEHCYECHSVEAGKSKGDLLLDSRPAIRKGGGSGPAIVPDSTEKSLLLGGDSAPRSGSRNAAEKRQTSRSGDRRF